MVRVGNVFTVTDVADEVAEQPLAFVIVTVLAAVLFTETDCDVSPVFHSHELPALAVRFTDPPAQNVVGPPAVIVADGNAFTVIVIADEVAVQPLAPVIVTVLFDDVFTVIDCVVSPVFHNQELPVFAVRFTEPPAQNVVALPAVIVADGKAFAVTIVADEVAEQPLPSVTVTVLLDEVFTVIDCVVSPVFHNQELPVLAVRFTEPPAQKVVAPPAVIVADGKAFTVTIVADEVAEQPLPSVTVTVLLNEVFTVIDWVVSPVFHNQEFPALAVRFTDPPAQKVVVLPAIMVGVGNGLTTTVVADEVAE
ncbi:MAG: hypothetical protein V4557_04705, partial [Bacteroidota bacterium]